MQVVRDFNERQSQLFFLVNSLLVRYQPPELQSLIDDPVRRARLGSAGPARARALCDPSTQIAALERALA